MNTEYCLNTDFFKKSINYMPYFQLKIWYLIIISCIQNIFLKWITIQSVSPKKYIYVLVKRINDWITWQTYKEASIMLSLSSYNQWLLEEFSSPTKTSVQYINNSLHGRRMFAGQQITSNNQLLRLFLFLLRVSKFLWPIVANEGAVCCRRPYNLLAWRT